MDHNAIYEWLNDKADRFEEEAKETLNRIEKALEEESKEVLQPET